MYRNVFFFHTINSIGGVETMFWELAKKYHKTFDITIYYIKGDDKQIGRLQQYVRVLKYNGEDVECERAFFNYNLEPFLSHVKAKRKYEIVHADFKLQKNLRPHIDPRIDCYVAVSKRVADSFREITGVDCQVCANPLTLEPIEYPPLFICSAQRLTSEKGGKRIEALINALDKRGVSYYYLIFSNEKLKAASPNVAYMEQRLDIRPYIYGCDLFVAVSDTEGRCYSVGEKLGYGTGKLLLTPCPSFFEQGCSEENSIFLNFDLSNMDEVIDRIEEYAKSKKPWHKFATHKPVDNWGKLLAKGAPTYDALKKYLVRATDVYERDNVYDSELKTYPKKGFEFIVSQIRLQTLQQYKYGALVEVVKEIG